MRTAPGSSVSAAAYAAGAAQAAHLGTRAARGMRITDKPFQNDPVPGYRDPVWSDFGSGYGLVTGRISALTAAGGAIFAGGADGGVWKSTQPAAGTGSSGRRACRGSRSARSPPTRATARCGSASARRTPPLRTSTASASTGSPPAATCGTASAGPDSQSRNIYHIHFDSAGHVYAATNAGLYRHSAAAAGPWHLVLKPDPNPTNSPYRTSQITDVTFQPGTGGRVVLAALGWRGGTLPSDLAFNGFYVSQRLGQGRHVPSHHPDRRHRRRRHRPHQLRRRRAGASTRSSSRRRSSRIRARRDGFTNLQGVYVSKSGNPAGPWTLVADATKLANSGSAEPALGQFPGAQTWYNQYIAVDPNNPLHVYVGMEEVYESTNGGQTWTTIAPYFNSVLPCFHGSPTDCPPTAHTDQHAVLITGHTYYTGSDGGVWRRPLADHVSRPAGST